MEVTNGGRYVSISDDGVFRATRAGDYTVKVTAVFNDLTPFRHPDRALHHPCL